MGPKTRNPRTTGRRYGFHFSIGGGVDAALEEAHDLGATAMQIFPGNPRGWNQRPFSDEEVERFRRLREAYDIRPVIIHLPYLPNLASPEPDLYRRSVEVLKDSVAKAVRLGVEFVNTHAGSRKDSPREEAIRRVAEACDEALEERGDGKVVILVENSAGGGSELGGRFEDLAEILAAVRHKDLVHTCFDTAHAFAAGYDLRTAEAVDRTFAEFDRAVGLDRLKAVHFNDSVGRLASSRDQHQHLGKGEIGSAGLRAVALHPALRNLPFIMETPQKTPQDDPMNLRTFLRYIRPPRARR